MNFRLSYLFERYLAGEISTAEGAELSLLILEAKNNDQLIELLEVAWNKTGREKDLSPEKTKEIIEKILKPTKVVKMNRWRVYSAAAAIVILLIAGYFWYRVPRTAYREQEIVKVQDVPAPDSTKATITLANGKVIVPKIINGEVEKGQWAVGNGQFEVLNNPRGSKIVSIELSDGTKVWLNSESSLKYPVEFNRRERRVSVTGEAYFEVAHNNSKFFVDANGTTTEVLGTHFNINSYETSIVTLLEGSIRVSSAVSATSAPSTIKLKPGEQTVNGEIKQVDTDEMIAWKNNVFDFRSTPLKDVMRQLSRWYDVDFTIQSNETLTVSGMVSRSKNLSEVLKIMEQAGVRVRIDARKIIVE